MSIKRNRFMLPLTSKNLVQNLKTSKTGEVLSTTFEVKNTSNTSIKLEIQTIENNLKIKENISELLPNQKSTITVLFDTKGLSGHQSKFFEVSAKGYEGKISFYINTEIK